MDYSDKYNEISEIINRAMEKESIPGTMSHDHLDMLADALGGVPCWGAIAGSPSAKAGLQYGDIVLEINGMPTPDYDAYFEARKLDKDKCAFKIWRNSEEIKGVMQFKSA
jgi:C-terminal processing protease CtpA/Prc